MLKELYSQVTADAQKSVGPKLIDLPGGKVLLWTPGEKSQVLEKDQLPIADFIGTYDSFVDWCEKHSSNLFIKVTSTHVAAFENREYAHKLQQAQLNLSPSMAASDLMKWCQQPRSQQQVVAGLRSALAGTYEESILPIFRRLDFQRKNDGSKTVSHTGESLGRSVEAVAQTASGTIPEYLTFTLQLYCNVLSPVVTMRFALDVDAVSETIRISPCGDAFATASIASTSYIAADLKKKMPDALVVVG